MNILTSLTYYRPHYSGLTVYAERLGRALGERGHRVTVLTSRYDADLPFTEQLDGVTVLRLPVGLRISKGVLMPSMLWRAWGLIRRADIVHLHLPQLDAAYLALVARFYRKPVVITYHCDLRLPAGLIHAAANLVSNLANRITFSLANAFVTNTRDYAENSPFLRQFLGKLHAILPPIEVAAPSQADLAGLRRRANIQPGDRIIGMAARLAAEKGVETLAEALPLVLEKFPSARVLFVGQHQNVFGEAAYARGLAPALEKMGAHWQFLGVVSEAEKAAFYHECELTVLPSLNSTESFGMVQAEAMLCGTPVVASDLPGVRQPVTLTGMGRVVPPGNPQALASAICEILASPGVFQRDPSGAAQAFTTQAVAQAYEQLFGSLTEQKR